MAARFQSSTGIFYVQDIRYGDIHNVHPAQQFVVAGGQLLALLDEARQAAELTQPERSLNVGHAVVKTEHLLLIVPRTMAFVYELF